MNFSKQITTLLLCATLSTAPVNILAGQHPVQVPDGGDILIVGAILAGTPCLAAGYLVGGGDPKVLAKIAKGLGIAAGTYVAGVALLVGTAKLIETIRDHYKEWSEKKTKIVNEGPKNNSSQEGITWLR